jgi:hypothetical protein
MKKTMLIAMAMLIGLSVLSRVILPWSQAKLESAAQLIVVGRVIQVRELNETNTTLWPGRCKLRGLEATFAVSNVLKGEFTNRTVVLHYYRWDTPFETSDPGSNFGTDIDSPYLIYLTPADTNQFILYLVGDGTSRYAPASGQLDTAYESVRRYANNYYVEPRVDQALTRQLEKVLKECQTIKPGMTRAELSRVFTTEGGLSTATHRTYVYCGCPYIKADVEFRLSDPKQGVLEEKPTDTIITISKPYLDWEVAD